MIGDHEEWCYEDDYEFQLWEARPELPPDPPNCPMCGSKFVSLGECLVCDYQIDFSTT